MCRTVLVVAEAAELSRGRGCSYEPPREVGHHAASQCQVPICNRQEYVKTSREHYHRAKACLTIDVSTNHPQSKIYGVLG